VARALLLIDIQNDYFPGGAVPLHEMEAAATQAARLLRHFRARGEPVIHVQHLSVRPGATFFIPGTPGAEHHGMVKPTGEEPVIQKNFPNSFRASTLTDTLLAQGVQELVIVGAMSHMCIDATTRAAFDAGYTCSVASDACTTRALQFNGEEIAAPAVHGAFMAALSSPYARVDSTAALLGD
jgi:nicotinamidase-related amidase